MKNTAIAAIGITLFGGFAVYAVEAPAPAPAKGGSALISDTTVNPNDSPLVRAAKNAVAARMRLTMHAASVIDNASLKSTGGHISAMTSEQAPLPSPPAATPADPSYPATPSPQEKAQIQGKIQNLKREQAAMQEEADSPYSNFTSEDQVTKRQTEIPNQINQLQNQLTPPPTTSTNPQQQNPPQ